MAPRFSGQNCKIAKFSIFFCLSIPKRDLDTKKTTPNIEFWPESLGAMLEYWYIERGLLQPVLRQCSNQSAFFSKPFRSKLTHQMFSSLSTFENATITNQFEFLRKTGQGREGKGREGKGREGKGRRFQIPAVWGRFSKAPFSWQISVNGKP